MGKLFDDSGKKILVVGDIILDRYHYGKVDRISPEAPIPVVLVTKSTNQLGGAANVANNISKLRVQPLLVGYIGEDSNADVLVDVLNENEIKYQLFRNSSPTITKTRIIAGIQQIVRVDFELSQSSSEDIEEELMNFISEELPKCDLIILSDYGKGLVTAKVSQSIITLCNKLDKILIIDPKGTDWAKYKRSFMVTPNIKELCDVLGRIVDNDDNEIEKAGKEVIDIFKLHSILITRSEKGMTFLDNNNCYHIRTNATEVFDVSGAGDTVVATLAAALVSGKQIEDALNISNKAAGIVVGKVGTVPITYDDLESSFFELNEDNKIFQEDNISELIDNLKNKRRKIVFTNGCFDIIHKGHIKYLQQAKMKGDVLIVGLNSDDSVKILKGQNRPIKDESERALILSSLEFVDYVVIFTSETPYELIKNVKPDVLVKGGDYNIEDVVGREFAKETILIDFVEGYSTTSTIEKMNDD